MPDFGGILRDLGIPWPDANEDDLYEAAAAWHRLADALRDGCGRANSAAGSLTSNNEGAAVDAFEKYWNKYGDRGEGALPLAAEACDAMGHACSKYADEVVAVKHKIEESGAEVGATLAIGTAGAFFTYGAAEGVADGLSALILDAASEAITALGTAMAGVAEDLSVGVVADAITAATNALDTSILTYDTTVAVGKGVTMLGNGAISGVGGAVLNDYSRNAVRELYGEKPLSSAQAASDLLAGARDGVVGGVLGKISELGQAQLAALLKNAGKSIVDTNVQLSMQMAELARQVEDMPGKITNDVITKAATQLVTAQQINADKLVKGEIPQVIKNAVIKDGG